MTIVEKFEWLADECVNFSKNFFIRNFFGRESIENIEEQYKNAADERKKDSSKFINNINYIDNAATLRDTKHSYTVNRRFIWAKAKKNTAINHSRLMRDITHNNVINKK